MIGAGPDEGGATGPVGSLVVGPEGMLPGEVGSETIAAAVVDGAIRKGRPQSTGRKARGLRMVKATP